MVLSFTFTKHCVLYYLITWYFCVVKCDEDDSGDEDKENTVKRRKVAKSSSLYPIPEVGAVDAPATTQYGVDTTPRQHVNVTQKSVS